jgi:hypothetical protein
MSEVEKYYEEVISKDNALENKFKDVSSRINELIEKSAEILNEKIKPCEKDIMKLKFEISKFTKSEPQYKKLLGEIKAYETALINFLENKKSIETDLIKTEAAFKKEFKYSHSEYVNANILQSAKSKNIEEEVIRARDSLKGYEVIVGQLTDYLKAFTQLVNKMGNAKDAFLLCYIAAIKGFSNKVPKIENKGESFNLDTINFEKNVNKVDAFTFKRCIVYCSKNIRELLKINSDQRTFLMKYNTKAPNYICYIGSEHSLENNTELEMYVEALFNSLVKKATVNPKDYIEKILTIGIYRKLSINDELRKKIFSYEFKINK